ncbi:menaquinol-cytochrome c reductase cytochrome b/c subunit [Bacillaceae bacterium]
MAKHRKDVKYVGDSRVPAERHPITAPSYSEFPGKTEPFYPNFLLKEWMVAVVVLVAFLVLTVSHPSPLEAKANPNDTTYTPLPDWYFLFLYQLLKYPWASGDYVVLGTVVIPGLAFGALLLAPWLDRGPERRPHKRPIATGLMLTSLIAIFYLTWASMAQHEWELKEKGGAPQTPPPAAQPAPSGGGEQGAELPNADDPGAKIWAKQANCQGCHGVDMKGQAGPDLTTVGARLSAEQIKEIIVNGKGTMPGGMFNGTEEELDTFVKYLAGLK